MCMLKKRLYKVEIMTLAVAIATSSIAGALLWAFPHSLGMGSILSPTHWVWGAYSPPLTGYGEPSTHSPTHWVWGAQHTLPHSLDMGSPAHTPPLTGYGEPSTHSPTHWIWGAQHTLPHSLDMGSPAHSLGMGSPAHTPPLTGYGAHTPPLTGYGEDDVGIMCHETSQSIHCSHTHVVTHSSLCQVTDPEFTTGKEDVVFRIRTGIETASIPVPGWPHFYHARRREIEIIATCSSRLSVRMPCDGVHIITTSYLIPEQFPAVHFLLTHHWG